MIALELLAPARTADIGIAAIRCGADAVYIGGPAFGARAAAGNSVEDIKRLCDFASHYGVRVFVTVNTLCRDDAERHDFVQMMLSLKGIGVSAFIMQDTSLLPLLCNEGPWTEEFHASTQCAIRTPERARFLASLGFHRLILERELSLEQIRAIHEAVPDMDLEFFVHGALCVCYSGDCYLSEALCGRSANRGECAQPCRNLYDLVDGNGKVLCKDKPLLSLKDYSLQDRLEDLAAAGVVSFKIEGRLKGESYVKNVVRSYSEALDRLVASSGGRYCRSASGVVSGGFIPDTLKTFNRGYTSLYIDGVRGAWHSEHAAKYIGTRIGGVIGGDAHRYIDIPVPGDGPLNNGDGLCTVTPDGEVVGFRADRVEAAGRPGVYRVYCKVPQGLAPGTDIWRNLDTAFEKQLERVPERMLRVALDITLAGSHLEVGAKREDGSTLIRSYDITEFEPASNRARMEEVLRTQLGKSTDGMVFSVENVCADVLPFMPASFINGIRRALAQDFSAVPVLPKGVRQSLPRQLDPSALDGANLSHPRREGELMRTKYCIRYRLGMCPKQKGATSPAPALYLRNNGRQIPLRFDCANCEMVLGEF